METMDMLMDDGYLLAGGTNAAFVATKLGNVMVLPPITRRESEQRVSFQFQPLQVPHVAPVKHDGEQVLFVRFAAPVAGSSVVAIPPMLENEVVLQLKEARRNGHRIERVVIVGTEPVFAGADAVGGDPREADGWELTVEALAGLMNTLVKERVPFTWRTRGGLSGTMPTSLSRALLDSEHLATIEIGLPSLDARVCLELEGGQGATPEERLHLASAATARGVSVRGLIDPLVPMLNDQRVSLQPLLQALVDAGVHRVAARYLVLTQERAKGLSRRLSRMHRALVQGIFAEQPWLPGAKGQTGGPHKRLPATLRSQGHQRLTDVAARVGIVVDVLDAVDEDEAVAGEADAPADKPKGRRRARRARPQLDLFRARR